jgi:ribosome biogenesis GTPase
MFFISERKSDTLFAKRLSGKSPGRPFLHINKHIMNNLATYGWSQTLAAQKQASPFNEYAHGRVVVTHKTCYDVVSESGTFSCELTGNMRYGRSTEEQPCTGDWVLFQQLDEAHGLIMDMLPREKTLYRLKSGSVSERQPLAAHVDKAFIVQSVDSNFNVRRLERFLLQTAEAGIAPVLVFTKTDLPFDKEAHESELQHIVHKVPVYYTSTHQPESIEQLREAIAPAETVIFTGSSGVGKSTLINALSREAHLATNSISNATGKGKHTTTRRELVPLQGGGILIDTPGIKLLGVTHNNPEALSSTLNISEFEGKCRFRDCRHINEEGCAVIEAVASGELDRGVYESYLKLRKEAWHYTASVHEKRKQGKDFARVVKEVKKSKQKNR